MLGYVFKITINQELHYSDNDFGNQLAKQLPNVKIFASNHFHDAFTSHFGTIWDLNVDAVTINGKLEIRQEPLNSESNIIFSQGIHTIHCANLDVPLALTSIMVKCLRLKLTKF